MKQLNITKNIAIANKESIICAWSLIEKKLIKYKTKFIPVDSEHFSIWSLLQNESINSVEKIIITASGGPFLNYKLNKLKNVKPKEAIRHPNWSMGKKISIDSATLMNKVFELMEAHKIFKIDLKKFKIIIHPNSYVHAIVKFKNGLSKILVHDTDMKIPIFNSLYEKKNKKITTKKIDFKTLNNLNFAKVDTKRFPSIKLINKIPNYNSLYETVIVSANDELVRLFLKKSISFLKITECLNKITNLNQFIKYKKIYPKNLSQIIDLDETVRLKTRTLSII